jgi:hypothetical protein
MANIKGNWETINAANRNAFMRPLPVFTSTRTSSAIGTMKKLPSGTRNPSTYNIITTKKAMNETKTIIIRTGVKDVDHLLITNLTDSNYNKIKSGIALPLPQEEIVVYTNRLKMLHNKQTPFIISLILNLILYLSGVVGGIGILLANMFAIKEQNKIYFILFTACISSVTILCGYAFFLNMEFFLYLF